MFCSSVSVAGRCFELVDGQFSWNDAGGGEGGERQRFIPNVIITCCPGIVQSAPSHVARQRGGFFVCCCVRCIVLLAPSSAPLRRSANLRRLMADWQAALVVACVRCSVCVFVCACVCAKPGEQVAMVAVVGAHAGYHGSADLLHIIGADTHASPVGLHIGRFGPVRSRVRAIFN